MVMPPATNSVNGIAHKPGLFLHCLTVADCNPCGASQIHIGVIKPGSSGRELTREIMIIVTIVRTVSIAKNSPYRIERYRECYIVFANTISPLWLSANDDVSITSPPITGIFGVISYSYASKAKVGYTNAKTVV